MKLKKSETVYQCDRCGAEYSWNRAYGFHGKKHDACFTGIRVMGSGTYEVKRLDLCDYCMGTLLGWLADSDTDRSLPRWAFMVENDEDC